MQTPQAHSGSPGNPELAATFLGRIADGSIVAGIVGLGYVGLPLAEALVRAGVNVLGFDVDETKLTALRSGRSYIRHISDSRIQSMMATGRLRVTGSAADLKDADALLMCVPTPLNIHREPDMSYVVKTSEALAKVLRKGHLVVLESTTYPGTSEELMKPILEQSGLKAGVDFGIAYSPEREDPGNAHFETSTIPKVVGADTLAERDMAVALYSKITKAIPVSNLKTAEAVKLTENIFRLINIALVNELKSVYGAMGIDVWEVIDAAKTKPFGFMAFYPGPGLGGHCIPIDPFYLTWKARAHGESTRFIELAGEVVSAMPKKVIEAVVETVNTKLKKSVATSRILVMGLAYKKNVDDMRESPSLHLISLLKARGAEVEFYDPYIPVVPTTRDHPEFSGLKSIKFTPDVLRTFDCALISTDHDNVDYEMLAQNIPMVIDTRNAMKAVSDELRNNVVKA